MTATAEAIPNTNPIRLKPTEAEQAIIQDQLNQAFEARHTAFTVSTLAIRAGFVESASSEPSEINQTVLGAFDLVADHLDESKSTDDFVRSAKSLLMSVPRENLQILSMVAGFAGYAENAFNREFADRSTPELTRKANHVYRAICISVDEGMNSFIPGWFDLNDQVRVTVLDMLPGLYALLLSKTDPNYHKTWTPFFAATWEKVKYGSDLMGILAVYNSDNFQPWGADL
jgi:hypothetical protein